MDLFDTWENNPVEVLPLLSTLYVLCASAVEYFFDTVLLNLALAHYYSAYGTRQARGTY
ncbi:hypothetical protein NWP17_14210 [Chrysosporum bergii ANA360D]|uniref:Uncharacterized protein n=1 Tax=Chrysosporum bergii ANA360D TaxID=617107 RepID=A0AA43KCU5_9CYAN|nr:hypothetical protein [Chrysosporum bergii]MDH6061575.1 hypothetical protein [Chrysosporum bergii ANA360D]